MKKCVIMYNITWQFVVTHLEGEIQFPALPSLYYGLAGLSLSNCKYLKTQHKWQGAVYFFLLYVLITNTIVLDIEIFYVGNLIWTSSYHHTYWSLYPSPRWTSSWFCLIELGRSWCLCWRRSPRFPSTERSPHSPHLMEPSTIKMNELMISILKY